MIDNLEHISPYGNGNKEPLFMLENVKISMKKEVGAGHMMVILKDGGISAGNKTLKSMAFRCLDNELGQAISNYNGEVINVIGKAKSNVWNGVKRTEFIIDDMVYV